MSPLTQSDLLDASLLEEVAQLRLVARRVPSGGRFADQPSRDRGAGIEFEDHRPYAPGDDLRSVDWALERRLGRVFVRLFEQQEDLPLYLLVDTSRSGYLEDPPRIVPAMARALAIEPALVALDEPFAALDVEGRVALRRSVRELLARAPGPRLLITHDPAEAFLLADRIHILEGGRVTQVGAPDEIRSRPNTPYAAALAGLNLLSGRNDGGRLTLDDSELELTTADAHTTGPVLITIHPNGVAVHLERPHGSPRNAWETELVAVEPLGEITRLTLAAPKGLAADVTPASVTAMDLRPGQRVWASVKATEVDVRPA